MFEKHAILKFLGRHDRPGESRRLFQFVQEEYAELAGWWERGEERLVAEAHALMMAGAHDKWFKVLSASASKDPKDAPKDPNDSKTAPEQQPAPAKKEK